MSRPPFNLPVVEAATPFALAHGHRLFQTFRYSADDQEHVDRLLEVLAPPPGGVVLDAGCGIGEASRLMAQRRPDLTFILANISPLQMSHCPSGPAFTHWLGDFHDLSLPAACVDAVMFSSALCSMDEAVALAQAHRVLRPGGVLMLNEPVRIGGDGTALEEVLACRTLTFNETIAAVEQAGFEVTQYTWPQYDDSHFREFLALDGLEHLLVGVRPLIVKARRN